MTELKIKVTKEEKRNEDFIKTVIITGRKDLVDMNLEICNLENDNPQKKKLIELSARSLYTFGQMEFIYFKK